MIFLIDLFHLHVHGCIYERKWKFHKKYESRPSVLNMDMYYNNETIKLAENGKRDLITPSCLDYAEISDLAVSCNKRQTEKSRSVTRWIEVKVRFFDE